MNNNETPEEIGKRLAHNHEHDYEAFRAESELYPRIGAYHADFERQVKYWYQDGGTFPNGDPEPSQEERAHIYASCIRREREALRRTESLEHFVTCTLPLSCAVTGGTAVGVALSALGGYALALGYESHLHGDTLETGLCVATTVLAAAGATYIFSRLRHLNRRD